MTEPVDPLVTIDDIRRAGHCPRGAKAWFEAHGLDFRTFVKPVERGGGLPASVLLATGDALAEQVVRRKREREDG